MRNRSYRKDNYCCCCCSRTKMRRKTASMMLMIMMTGVTWTARYLDDYRELSAMMTMQVKVESPWRSCWWVTRRGESVRSVSGWTVETWRQNWKTPTDPEDRWVEFDSATNKQDWMHPPWKSSERRDPFLCGSRESNPWIINKLININC